MPSTVQAILNTPDLDRAKRFYAHVFGAIETSRVPDEGPIFYLGLRIGDSDFGLVVNADTEVGKPQRILLSIKVDDVDGVAALVPDAGGELLGSPNNMPWGQRVAHVLDPDGNMVNLTQDLS
jgi:predicted enzyme related to lactoylglutathione lyase